MTAKPVRPLLSRQFTAAVAAGPGRARRTRNRCPRPVPPHGAHAHAARPPHTPPHTGCTQPVPLATAARQPPTVERPGPFALRARPPLAAAPSSSHGCRPFEFFLWIFFYFRRINGNFVQGRRDDSPPGAATDGRGIWGIGRGCWPTEVGARAGGCVVRGERTRAGYAPLCPGAPASLRVLWCWLTGVCLVRRTSVDHCWRLSGCVG